MNLLTAFWGLFLCFRGGGSFRSGVQPPTGSRVGATPDRLRPAQEAQGRREKFGGMGGLAYNCGLISSAAPAK